MFKPHHGKCTICGQSRLLVIKALVCDKCNYHRKQAKKALREPRKAVSETLLQSKVTNYENIHITRTTKVLPSVGKNKKSIPKIRKATGEREMFIEIWDERDRLCSACGIVLGYEPKAGFFAHILPKGTYGRYRLNKENITLMCLQCHTEYDHGDKNKPKFKEVNEKAERLKREYNEGR